MTPEKRIQQLTTWQIALFVVPILLQILRMLIPVRADDDRQLVIALVRFSITAICLVLVGVIEFRKRKIHLLARSTPNPTAIDSPSTRS